MVDKTWAAWLAAVCLVACLLCAAFYPLPQDNIHTLILCKCNCQAEEKEKRANVEWRPTCSLPVLLLLLQRKGGNGL